MKKPYWYYKLKTKEIGDISTLTTTKTMSPLEFQDFLKDILKDGATIKNENTLKYVVGRIVYIIKVSIVIHEEEIF